MTLQNDDLLLVNRGGQSFKTEYGVLKENINEDQGVTISETAPADPHEGDLWYNSEDGRLYVWYVNETTGIVTSVSIRNGGSGYTTQETNVETAGGEGFGLTVDIDPGVGGNLANPQVNNGGHGYKVGDYIIVIGAGHQNGTLNVTAINTASVGQWVDASPDGGDVGGGPDLWQRTGTTLSPQVAGDDVDLGTGDLSAAAGTFSGQLTTAFDQPSGFVASLVNQSTTGGDVLYMNARDVGSAIVIQRQSDNQNSFILRGDGQVQVGNDGSGNPNITLNADGSADFAGNVKVGKYDANNETVGGIQLSYNSSLERSALSIQGKSTSDTAATAFVIRRGKAEAYKITYGGSAAFSNVNFNLEPDDPANYTTTTVDGEETQVYSGPTLDVKDRILNLISRLDALEANEVIDDATDTSLLQLLANASARLDSIEARLTALEGGN